MRPPNESRAHSAFNLIGMRSTSRPTYDHGSALIAVPCLSYFAPRRRRNQRQKGPIIQLHGVALSFHRQIQDAPRELVWPDVVMAVGPEGYPRFIKSGFHDHEG